MEDIAVLVKKKQSAGQDVLLVQVKAPRGLGKFMAVTASHRQYMPVTASHRQILNRRLAEALLFQGVASGCTLSLELGVSTPGSV